MSNDKTLLSPKDDERTLLELAAKAAGIELKWMTQIGNGVKPDEVFISNWHPLTDDGDAFRLALKLELFWDNMELFDVHMDGIDHLPMYVRRAIVRAAAEIGKTL